MLASAMRRMGGDAVSSGVLTGPPGSGVGDAEYRQEGSGDLYLTLQNERGAPGTWSTSTRRHRLGRERSAGRPGAVPDVADQRGEHVVEGDDAAGPAVGAAHQRQVGGAPAHQRQRVGQRRVLLDG